MPLANSFLTSKTEATEEKTFPLATALCPSCGLVQLNFVVPAEVLYSHYLYVSSTSDAVRQHAKALALQVVQRNHLDSKAQVVELGSNDGLVLKAFQEAGVGVLGIEPAKNIAQEAQANGVPTVNAFFSEQTAGEVRKTHGAASIILGRHVFAHIDDWHNFFRGVDQLLSPTGTLLIEVPYLGTLLKNLEFDTIYHEHLSYVSLKPIETLSKQHGFKLVDVESVSLHGGSVLLWIARHNSSSTPSQHLLQMQQEEARLRLDDPATWAAFAERVSDWKGAFERLAETLTQQGARWVGYGAAAKANTLLNFCPKVAQKLTAVLDKNPLKHGRLTPGTHLPVQPVEALENDGISHMLILAWNFKEEIISQMQPFARGGGRFVVPIPNPEVV